MHDNQNLVASAADELSAWLAAHPAPTGEQLAQAGYVVPHWPAPWGLGAAPADQLVIDAILRTANVRRPDNPIGIGWAGPTLLAAGTVEQQQRWLPGLLSGEEFWCQLFSEPAAGSDLSALSTQAVRDGDPARAATAKPPAAAAPITAQATLNLFPQAPCPVKYEAAKALLAFFASTYGRDLLRRLDALGIQPVAGAATTVSSGPLSGQSFAITGTLGMPRTEMETRIKAAGGKIVDAVTRKTTFLVTGEDPGGTKYRKAQELSIPLLTEPELLARITAPPPVQQPTFL